MWHSRPPRDPPPFMANAILNFHFDYLNPSLIRRRRIFSQRRRKKKQRKKRMKMFGEGKYFQRKKRLRFLLSEMYLLSNLLGFVNDWEDTALWLLTSVLPKSKKEEKTQNYLNAVLSQVLHNSLIFVSNAIIKRIVTYTVIKSQISHLKSRKRLETCWTVFPLWLLCWRTSMQDGCDYWSVFGIPVY